METDGGYYNYTIPERRPEQSVSVLPARGVDRCVPASGPIQVDNKLCEERQRPGPDDPRETGVFGSEMER